MSPESIEFMPIKEVTSLNNKQDFIMFRISSLGENFDVRMTLEAVPKFIKTVQEIYDAKIILNKGK